MAYTGANFRRRSHRQTDAEAALALEDTRGATSKSLSGQLVLEVTRQRKSKSGSKNRKKS